MHFSMSIAKNCTVHVLYDSFQQANELSIRRRALLGRCLRVMVKCLSLFALVFNLPAMHLSYCRNQEFVQCGHAAMGRVVCHQFSSAKGPI